MTRRAPWIVIGFAAALAACGRVSEEQTPGLANDYADGLVRVGVQSASPQPETAALIRKLMQERGLPVPPEGRTFDSICVTDICK